MGLEAGSGRRAGSVIKNARGSKGTETLSFASKNLHGHGIEN